MRWKSVQNKYVGKKFIRRKDGKSETRKVVDSTLGCDIVYVYGQKLRNKRTVTIQEWEIWANDAKEIAQ